MATPTTFASLASTIVQYLDTGTGILITVAIVLYFSGVVVHLYRQKEGGSGGKEWSTYLLWGLIIIFCMVTIVGLVNILQDSIFGSGPV